jgi:hypothetical protein
MDYILSYPKSNEGWFRFYIDSFKAWWMKKQAGKAEENYFLIN